MKTQDKNTLSNGNNVQILLVSFFQTVLKILKKMAPKNRLRNQGKNADQQQSNCVANTHNSFSTDMYEKVSKKSITSIAKINKND